MPGPYSVFIDLSEDVGSRLAPEVVDEIIAVAPSTVNDGDIYEAKLADDSISTRCYQDESIPATAFTDDTIPTSAYAPGSVDTAALAANAVTAAKAGTGVVTAVDSTGNVIACKEWYGTATQYAAVTPKDPNTTYYCTA